MAGVMQEADEGRGTPVFPSVVRWLPTFADVAGLLIYLFVLTFAEVAVSTVNPLLVFPLHAGLIALTGVYFFLRRERTTADSDARIVTAAAVALTVAPLIRIISLTLPLAALEPIYRYVAAGVPMTIAGLLAARAVGFGARQVGLTFRHARWQVWIVGLSIIFGFMEFVILRPEPLGPAPWTASGIWPALAIGTFTGFPEELIFRGVLQTALRPILGRWNWVYASGLFAVLHVGYASYLDIVFVFAVGLVYGWVFEQTRSIIGVSIGHGLANVILFFVAPNLIAPSSLPTVAPWMDALLAIAFGLALTAFGLFTFVSRRDARTPADLKANANLALGPLRLTVAADPAATSFDLASGIVPAGRRQLPVTSRITASATGVQRRTPHARGFIRLISVNTAGPIFVAADTVLLSTGGQRFRTTHRAFLGRAPVGGTAVAEVPIVAETPGPEGDAPAGAVRHLPLGLAAEGVSATNEAPVLGGGQSVVRRITAEDYNAARITASLQAWDQIRGLLLDGATDAGVSHLALVATRVKTTSIEPDADYAIGRQGESIELTVRRMATATVVDLDRLRDVAVAHLEASVRSGFALIPSSIVARVVEVVTIGDSAVFTLDLRGHLRRAGDDTEAGDHLAA